MKRGKKDGIPSYTVPNGAGTGCVAGSPSTISRLRWMTKIPPRINPPVRWKNIPGQKSKSDDAPRITRTGGEIGKYM